MTKIQEIEQQLAQARKEEQTSYLNKDFEEIKKQYEGKCFGTHTFERNNKAAYSSAVFIEKFYIEDNNIFVLEWYISINKQDKYYKFSSSHINFNKSKRERKLTGNNYNVQYNLNLYSSRVKELPYANFIKLWNNADNFNEYMFEKFDETIVLTDQLRIGTANDEDRILEGLKNTGIKYIDLFKYKELLNILMYKRLPFLQEQRFLPTLLAKTILEYQIKLNNEEMKNIWVNYTSRERLTKENNILENFINTL